MSGFTGYSTGTRWFLSCLNVGSYCACQCSFTRQDLRLGAWRFATTCSVLSDPRRRQSASTLRRQRDGRQGVGGNLLATVAIAQGFGSWQIGWRAWGSQRPPGWGCCKGRFRCVAVACHSHMQRDCEMFRQPSVVPSGCRDLRGWSVTYGGLPGPHILNT